MCNLTMNHNDKARQDVEEAISGKDKRLGVYVT